MFSHFLITRFNLKNPDWKLTKNNETVLDDRWMDDRLQLFEKFCLPSVTNQTNQNFEWLLFFDTSTNENYRLKINALLKNHENIIPLYINGMTEFYNAVLDYINKNAAEKEYLITSRIDNDDCIHKDYINEIQNQFAKQELLVVDSISGYTLKIGAKYILGKKEHIFNPFISLIERNINPKTVWFHHRHSSWKKESRLIYLTQKRLWLSIIHEKNKVNQFDGYGKVEWKTLNQDFKIAKEIDDKIIQNQLPFSKWRLLSLKNFMFVKLAFSSKQFKRKLGLYKLK